MKTFQEFLAEAKLKDGHMFIYTGQRIMGQKHYHEADIQIPATFTDVDLENGLEKADIYFSDNLHAWKDLQRTGIFVALDADNETIVGVVTSKHDKKLLKNEIMDYEKNYK